MTSSAASRIELVWPGKGLMPRQERTGRWRLNEPTRDRVARSFDAGKVVRPNDSASARSIAVLGDRLDAFALLSRVVGRGVALAYADVPRLEGFDETRAFLGAEGKTFSVWLSTIREHFEAAKALLTRRGILVAQAGDLESPFVRLLLIEAFGRENYIGTIVWRTHYSPKGGKESNEIAPIHENLICFAYDKLSVKRIALPVSPEGYSNPDDDPRGDWEARQKDAGRDTVKLIYHVPPYRWSITKGKLPRGLWRLSPMSGVIWGTPQEAGDFRFRVRIEDASGNSSERDVRLKISNKAKAESFERPDAVWWMIHPPKKTKSSPRVKTDILRDGVVGNEYSDVLVGTGGSPFTGSPRPSRGWAFGQATLMDAVLADRCYFGKKGDAIPETKKYAKDLPDGVKLINLTSWWEETGLSQDSTKHQNALHAAGIIQLPNQTAKPESLLSRLLSALTRERSLVLEVFARSGDLSAVALKTGRDFIALFGGSDLDREFAAQSGLPRLEAVACDMELKALSDIQDIAESKREVFLRAPGRAGYRTMEIGKIVTTQMENEEHPRLCVTEFRDDKALMKGVLTSEGYFVHGETESAVAGESWDGRRSSTILSPRVFLDQSMAADFASSVEAGHELAIYYFRSADDFAPERIQTGVSFRRVPYELTS